MLVITGMFLSRWQAEKFVQAEEKDFAAEIQERMLERGYIPWRDDPEDLDFGETAKLHIPSVTKIIYEYHKNVNWIVNEYTEALIIRANKAYEESNNPIDANIFEKGLVPVENIAEDCELDGSPVLYDDYNISTACLAVRLTEEYIPFAYRMEEWKKEISDLVNVSTEMPLCDVAGKEIDPEEHPEIMDVYQHRYDTAIAQARLRSEMIDRELENAKKAMDLTLAAYNELQMALPLHMRYMRIVRELEKFRDSLGDLRSVVEAYPSIFPNASTTKCT